MLFIQHLFKLIIVHNHRITSLRKASLHFWCWKSILIQRQLKILHSPCYRQLLVTCPRLTDIQSINRMYKLQVVKILNALLILWINCFREMKRIRLFYVLNLSPKDIQRFTHYIMSKNTFHLSWPNKGNSLKVKEIFPADCKLNCY